MKYFSQRKGSILVMTFLIGLGAVILISAIANILNSSSHQVGYINRMKDVHTVAEYGFSQALSRLLYYPHSCDLNSTDNLAFVAPGLSIPGYSGSSAAYQNQCLYRSLPTVANCNYVVTYATLTEAGRVYTETLHSYVSVAPVSSYFAAVNGDLTVALNTVAPNANLYARDNLTFALGGGIHANRAEYYGSVSPAPPNAYWPPNPSPGAILTQNGGLPIHLNAPLLFPTVTQADDIYWSAPNGSDPTRRSHTNAQTCTFSGLLFPPGFEGWSVAWNPNSVDPDGNAIVDTYSNHVADNGYHIYYCPGDVSISSVTYAGQILIVSTGNIVIHGDVREFNPNGGGTDAAGRSASNLIGAGGLLNGAGTTQPINFANQLVLIPGPNMSVSIAADQTTPGILPPQATVPYPGNYLQVIQAFVFTPTGAFGPDPNAASLTLCLNFTGAMVLGANPTSFGNVYNGSCIVGGVNNPRVYSYMDSPTDSLLLYPPPYMPALSEIYNQFVEITSASGAFSQ